MTIVEQSGVQDVYRDDDCPEHGYVPIQYQRRDDGWYVKTPEDGEFWRFAHESAGDRTVRQLISKKWSSKYAVDPDDLDDRS